MEKTLSIEEKLLQQVKKKKRRKRNRRLLRIVILLFTITMIGLYLSSDLSKVKSLTVKNNTHYTDEQILELAGIDYDSNYLLTFRLFVNYKLEKDPLIKDAKLQKDIHGGFTITIEEEKVIGYLEENSNLLLIQGHGSEKVKNVSLKSIPRIGRFSDEQLKKLDESFKDVDSSILTMISEILPHSETYNNEMVRIIMNDGNRVTASYDGIYLLNNYKRILPQLEGTHVCLFMDELSGNIIKQSVDCTQNSNISEDDKVENIEINGETIIVEGNENIETDQQNEQEIDENEE